MFTFYLPTKFHMPSSNGSRVIDINPKAIENLRMTALLLILYNIILTHAAYFFKIRNHWQFQDP
jgi:hypothetical protein